MTDSRSLPDRSEPVSRAPRLSIRCPECDYWDAARIACPHGCGVHVGAVDSGDHKSAPRRANDRGHGNTKECS